MKYGYSFAELEDIIENYKTSKDKIIITFLDGSNYEIPLTEKNERDLLNQMIEQARVRSNSSALYDAKEKRKKTLMWTISQISFTVLNIILFSTSDIKAMRVFTGVLGSIIAITAVIDGFGYKFTCDEIKELEKYDIYLSIMSKLENATDPNLFNGVKKQEEPLNINTLDNYSLKDIKKIRDNLKRSEKYKSYFEETYSNQTLVKKIGK